MGVGIYVLTECVQRLKGDSRYIQPVARADARADARETPLSVGLKTYLFLPEQQATVCSGSAGLHVAAAGV